MSIVKAFFSALRDLFQLRVMWLMVWPMLLSLLLWLVVGIAFWDSFSQWLLDGLEYIGARQWLDGVEPRWIATGILIVLHLMLFVPLVLLTALMITAFFVMPALIRIVSEQHYPELKRENGGTVFGNLANAALALAIFIALLVLTLPLWLLGVGVLMPFIAAGYLNQRLFRYDALAEHASAAEMKQLAGSGLASWWALGLLTGLMQFLPILNLFAPVMTALVFIHFGLARLQEARNNP